MQERLVNVGWQTSYKVPWIERKYHARNTTEQHTMYVWRYVTVVNSSTDCYSSETLFPCDVPTSRAVWACRCVRDVCEWRCRRSHRRRRSSTAYSYINIHHSDIAICIRDVVLGTCTRTRDYDKVLAFRTLLAITLKYVHYFVLLPLETVSQSLHTEMSETQHWMPCVVVLTRCNLNLYCYNDTNYEK